MVGGLIFDLIWRVITIVDELYIVFDFVSHMWHVCQVLGRCRMSVKPTGHARFSVELFTYLRNKKPIYKVNQLDQMGFNFFISFLCCESLSLIHNVF